MKNMVEPHPIHSLLKRSPPKEKRTGISIVLRNPGEWKSNGGKASLIIRGGGRKI